MLIAQFDVPVGEIDKVPPAFMLWSRKRDLHKRTPLWPFRPSNQAHVRFLRKPISFTCVTCDARANHIFPCRRPSPVARHHMIEIQLVTLKNPTAILAGVFVALKNVVPRKLHFLLRETIEKQQHDHARHANFPRNSRNHFVFRRSRGKIAPTLKIVRHKIVCPIRRNDVSMAGINQRKRAPGRADVHRLPEPVQHQNLTVQRCMQISMVNCVLVRLLQTST